MCILSSDLSAYQQGQRDGFDHKRAGYAVLKSYGYNLTQMVSYNSGFFMAVGTKDWDWF